MTDLQIGWIGVALIFAGIAAFILALVCGDDPKHRIAVEIICGGGVLLAWVGFAIAFVFAPTFHK